MKIRYLLALAGLAISFALPTFAQQAERPEVHESLAHEKSRKASQPHPSKFLQRHIIKSLRESNSPFQDDHTL
jgi:hypothetical protein